MLFDAKYKLASRGGGYPNADHYQMLAYCTALGVDVGWLAYAHGIRPITERAIQNSSVRIVEYPLDLSADPQALLNQVRRLADDAWAKTAGPVGRRVTAAIPEGRKILNLTDPSKKPAKVD